jgi:ankyrin repeat protein
MKFDKASDIPCLFNNYIKNETILHKAVDLANVEVVKYLIDCKMNIHEKNIHGFTPLDIAIINSSYKQKFKNMINKLTNQTPTYDFICYINQIKSQITNKNPTQKNDKVADLILKVWYKNCILEFYNLFTFIKLSKNIKCKNMIIYILYNYYLKEIIVEKDNIL